MGVPDIRALSIEELKDLLGKANHEEKNNIVKQYKDYLLGDELKKKLEVTNANVVIDIMLSLPEDFFPDFISAHEEVIAQKILEVEPNTIAKIFETLSTPMRKEFNRRFRIVVENRVRKMGLRDILRMIYNVSPPNRSSLLSAIKAYLMHPDFETILLKEDLETLEEFLSVLPEDTRTSLVKRHKNFLLGDKFGEKVREASNEAIVNVLRWFPKDIYDEFVRTFKSILEEKGLRL